MECLSVAKLPEGSQWVWEIKLDGYRALAVKSRSAVTLYSRNRKILNKSFPYIVEPLRDLPNGTVVDGEIVALDNNGRPDFNLLQNFQREASRIRYFISIFSFTKTAILPSSRFSKDVKCWVRG